METTNSVNQKYEYYVSLPNLGYAIRKSSHPYKFAVIARYRMAEGQWQDWYVARWSTSLELANGHAHYLESGCPAVKKHGMEFETKVVPITQSEAA